jgi:hypothetical protein
LSGGQKQLDLLLIYHMLRLEILIDFNSVANQSDLIRLDIVNRQSSLEASLPLKCVEVLDCSLLPSLVSAAFLVGCWSC